MSDVTAQMGLTRPTAGGDDGIWDDSLREDLAIIDVHDHTTGKGVRIPAGGLNITTDLTFAGTAALTNAKAVNFTAQASYTTNKSLFVLSADNELYWRSNAGVNVKITSGAGLNMSLVGGITGDYAAASASFYYDQANLTYRALQAAPLPNVWAAVACGNLDLYEKASGISTRVRLQSPAALGASYALTFPAAVPGSTQLAQVSSAGVITFSNTVTNAATFSGLITASAGVTCAANQNVTVSGTGDYKHGDKVLYVSPLGGTSNDGASSGAVTWYPNFAGYAQSHAAGVLYVAIPLKEGDQVTTVTYSLFGDGAADLSASTGMYRMPPGGTPVALGTGAQSNPAAAWNDITINVTDYTLASGNCIYMAFDANAANIRIGTIRVTYNRP